MNESTLILSDNAALYIILYKLKPKRSIVTRLNSHSLLNFELLFYFQYALGLLRSWRPEERQEAVQWLNTMTNSQNWLWVIKVWKHMQEAVTHRELSFQKLLSKWATLGDVYRIYFPLNSWVQGENASFKMPSYYLQNKDYFFLFFKF